MPTTIAIESTTASAFGVQTPFQHLYLVKRVTDGAGNVLEEKVIRGGPGRSDSLVTQANIDLAASADARGKDTLAQRHHTPLDLNGRDPDAVWNLMVQHASNINRADLEYSVDLFNALEGDDLNSNTVVASALHTVGISLAGHLPRGVSSREVPLYNRVGDMRVDDALVGGSQPDSVYGGVGNDRINGGDNNDRLFGEPGVDVLIGGKGNDILNGGVGADRMNGGLGDDVYHVDDAGDRVIETNASVAGGTDRVWSTISVNLLGRSDLAGLEQVAFQGSSDLSAKGNVLANFLIGNSGANILSGGAGDDILSGGIGDDKLLGGLGNDSLRAGAGNDLLTGGVGLDVLSGGAGADTFVFKSVYESRPDPTAGDVIVDFSASDFVDVRGIDADTTTSGNQAFSFIGSAAFSDAGQLRFERDAAGNAIVQVDVNGDLAADFQVTLRSYAQTLSASDFML
jgi:Ca2+-binding RTX toxin-like protein